MKIRVRIFYTSMLLLALALLLGLASSQTNSSATLYVVANRLTLSLPLSAAGLEVHRPKDTTAAVPLPLADLFSAATLVSPDGHIDVTLANATVIDLRVDIGAQSVELVVRLSLDEIGRVIEQIHTYDNFFGMTVVLNGNFTVDIVKYFCMFQFVLSVVWLVDRCPDSDSTRCDEECGELTAANVVLHVECRLKCVIPDFSGLNTGGSCQSFFVQL